MAKKSINLRNKDGHPWTFASIGGVTRVTINSGEDIAHLDELDQKLWTVLSCPTTGLEFDGETLSLLDLDGDMKIRVQEIIAAAKYLVGCLRNSDDLLLGHDHIDLSAINDGNDDGKAIIEAARRILGSKESSQITLADVAAARAVLDEAIKAKDDATAATVDNRPYGDATDDAIAALGALRSKVDDFFMRCKLIAFNNDCTAAVDVSVEKIQAISEKNLAQCTDQIADYPLARPNKDILLPLGDAINPAWQAEFDKIKSIAIAADYPEATAIDQGQWNAIAAKLDAYVASLADNKSAKIETFDKDMAQQDADITLVNKFLHLYRDFYKLLRNYVVFSDFYTRDPNKLAVFQAGCLYIDQRRLDLCIKVSDMGKQADMAALSGLFLVYCHCTSKVKAAEMDIVSALTDGDIDDLRVGKNAIFYDRTGQDWDATVTRIVDNPISIRQAFWSPYKKLWNWITEKINKSAADKEKSSMDNLVNKTDGALTNAQTNISSAQAEPNAPAPAPADAAAAKKGSAFDIAKFAGIFAAIGMAFGFIMSALTSLGKGITEHWYNLPLLIIGIIVVVSGPSMFIAWSKLRRRNLGPVLNANGWAINAQVRVNTAFGATLTSLAKYPLVKLPDPYADKKMPAWKKWLITLIVLAAIFCALYFTNTLKYVGLPFKKEVPQVVEAADEAVEADAPEAVEVADVPSPDDIPAE